MCWRFRSPRPEHAGAGRASRIRLVGGIRLALGYSELKRNATACRSSRPIGGLVLQAQVVQLVRCADAGQAGRVVVQHQLAVATVEHCRRLRERGRAPSCPESSRP